MLFGISVTELFPRLFFNELIGSVAVKRLLELLVPDKHFRIFLAKVIKFRLFFADARLDGYQ